MKSRWRRGGVRPQVLGFVAAAALLIGAGIAVSVLRFVPPQTAQDAVPVEAEGFSLTELQNGAAADVERLKALFDGVVQSEVKAEAERLQPLLEATVLASIQNELQNLRPVSIRPSPDAVPPVANAIQEPAAIAPARLIPATRSMPPYPPESLRRKEQGTVTLLLSITPDGTVSDAKVEQSSGSPRLDNAAIQWVKQRWRYEPAMLGTVPISATSRVNLTFQL